MAKKQSTTSVTKNSTETVYQSNPFALSFDKFGQFFEKNLGWAIALIILPIFGFFFQLLISIIDAATTPSAGAHGGHAHPEIQLGSIDPATVGLISLTIVLVAVLLATIIVISVAIQTFISGLFSYVALENEAGRTARFSVAIDEVVARFWRLFLAQLLATAKIFGWTLLLIIPGIVAVFRYALLPYVIMDEPASKKGVKDSHDRVKALVAGRKREVFGVATVATIIPIIGNLIQFIGNAALYRQLQVFHDKKLEKPAVHWLNYFGFILIGLYALLIIFIAAIAILATVSTRY